MLYASISLVVPFIVYVGLPFLVTRTTTRPVQRDWALLVACLFYFVSWYIPSPLIEGRDTSFMTHLIGGGIFSGFLWLWCRRQLEWKGNFLQEIMTLYAFVCTLGVSNELFEFVIAKGGLVPRLNSSDAWWDLVANTVGAGLFWIGYKLVNSFSKK